MKVLTYTSNKEHYNLYTETNGSIAINSCQIEHPPKYIILPSEVSIVIYNIGKRTCVENDKFLHFNLSVGTYFIDDFNTKVEVAILQQSQKWELSQIKNLRLVTPEGYTFMADNHIFIALGIQDNYLEKTALIRSTLHPGRLYNFMQNIP